MSCGVYVCVRERGEETDEQQMDIQTIMQNRLFSVYRDKKYSI